MPAPRVALRVARSSFADAVRPGKGRWIARSYHVDANDVLDQSHQKYDPFTNRQEPDNIWDFFSHSPEATHQFTWLFGDRGIPASYREMDGFGSHTFQWVNAQGERFWVKCHFKTDQKIRCLTSADAALIGGKDPAYIHKDLYDAISRGQFPSWTVKVQVMPEKDAGSYRFNPFDLTKVWL
jgi:catalase